MRCRSRAAAFDGSHRLEDDDRVSLASLRTPGKPRTTAASCLVILPSPIRVPLVVRTTRSARTLVTCCSRAPVAHCKHADQCSNGAGHADHDRERSADPLRNAGQIDAQNGEELPDEFHTRLTLANAATMFNRAARSLGPLR